MSFTRLVRFVPEHSSAVAIGEPVDAGLDVGAALRAGRPVAVALFSGSSVLAPGERTARTARVARLLAPLAASEVGAIRCIRLNYRQHTAKVGAELPAVPTLFIPSKPSTALADPWPAPVPLPALSQQTDCADYEAELAVVIGRRAKNVPEHQALDYVLGYTACSDVSSRTSQFAQSQWCFFKGFDGACPLGPALVSAAAIPDPSRLRVRGLHNGRVVQDCGTDDLVFGVPQLVSFLSQSTTLLPGSLIVTGTPAGVGAAREPKVTLRHGDEFAVKILPHIGTLVNVFENETVVGPRSDS